MHEDKITSDEFLKCKASANILEEQIEKIATFIGEINVAKKQGQTEQVNVKVGQINEVFSDIKSRTLEFHHLTETYQLLKHTKTHQTPLKN